MLFLYVSIFLAVSSSHPKSLLPRSSFPLLFPALFPLVCSLFRFFSIFTPLSIIPSLYPPSLLFISPLPSILLPSLPPPPFFFSFSLPPSSLNPFPHSSSFLLPPSSLSPSLLSLLSASLPPSPFYPPLFPLPPYISTFLLS